MVLIMRIVSGFRALGTDDELIAFLLAVKTSFIALFNGLAAVMASDLTGG